ncbi:MAG: AMP-binding protein [Candidatus Xiphinematobacter sp.]|nr:MAG: AMP-binding protein [Candidatus Xiphinematobacter sp.]
MHEFPASPMQEAIYAASTADTPHGTAITGNIQISFNFGEPVDIQLLQKSWKWVTRRHGLLRSSFSKKTGDILSFHEHEDCETTWRSLDWCNLSGEQISTQWNRLQAEDATEPFTLLQPPLLRFCSIKLPRGMHHFLWTCHSILLDRESIFLVLRDWLVSYEELSYGRQPSLQEPPSYAAAIGAVESIDPAAARRHWKCLLQRVDPLPLIATSPLQADCTPVSPPLKHEDFLLERETTKRLIHLTNLANTSLPVLLAAAWGLVLGRISINGEAMFGIYRSCRHLSGPQAAESVGLFESFLPFPIQIPEDLTCEMWLRSLQEVEVNTEPFLISNIQEVWNHLGRSDPFPQLSSTLNFLPESINSRIHACLPQWMRFDARIHQYSRFPIQVLACGEERLSIGIEYLPSKISPRIVHQLCRRLFRALHHLTEPNTPISEIKLNLPSEEEESVRLGMGVSRSVQPTSLDLFTALQRIAQLYGSCTFVERGNDSLSFSLMEIYSSQFSTFLRSRSIGTGTVLALMMPSSPWTLVALLGALRAGCTCLPLDPEALPDELGEYLSRHQVSTVIADRGKEVFPGKGKIQQTLLVLEESLWRRILSLPRQAFITALSPASPMVSVLHSNRDRRVISYAELQTVVQNAICAYNVQPNDRILCHHLQGSAAAIEECFVALLTGATLIFPEKNIKSTRTAFQETLESVGITHLRLTAAFWSQWIHYLSELHHSAPRTLHRIVIEAGHVSPSIISKWEEQNTGQVECVVFYSPSEFLGGGVVTEILGTPQLCKRGLVCGRPQPGVAVFLVDSHQRQLPPYSPGVLAYCLYKNIQSGMCEDGKAVAATMGGRTWQLSITDEWAQWNSEGQLVLISQPYSQPPGVLDWITLRRIEGALTSHPDIMDSVVRSFTPIGEQSSCLGAWIVLRDSHVTSLPTTLDPHLKEHLPRELIPTHFALVTRFHLDPFDQINSLFLASPKFQPILASTVPPQGEVEAGGYLHPNPATGSLRQSPIVTLQTGTSGSIALYFIHAGRGLAEDYLPIAQSLSNKYAIHCFMVSPSKLSASLATVEEITCSSALVLRKHLSGDFVLVGIGVGAVFAWELAHQLDQEDEKSLSLILFDIPPIGRKPARWLRGLRKAFLREKTGPKDLVEIIAEYQPPALQRGPYFFARGKPDPQWCQRSPMGIWSQLYLEGRSPLDKPAEVASLLTGVLSAL